jgi:hypothetical protein
MRSAKLSRFDRQAGAQEEESGPLRPVNLVRGEAPSVDPIQGRLQIA